MKKLIKEILWLVLQTRFFNEIRPRIMHTRSFLLKGKTKGNFNLSILVLTNNENIVNYISNLAYPQEKKVEAIGRVAYHNISSIVEDTKPDAVFVELEGILSNSFSKKTFLIMPHVNFSLETSPPFEIIMERMMRVRRRNIKKIEKLSYTYEVTKSLEKLDFFYHEIYLPFTSKTAKADFARLTPIDVAKDWFQKGELLLVKSHDTYVSGLLYHPENSALHCRLLAYTEEMAGQAALYRLIRMSKEKGYTKIDYGGTSPFMNDGLFFYKKSWGMKIKPDIRNVKDYKILAAKLCNFEEAIQDFLHNNPFIFTDLESLIALILLDSNDLSPDSLYRRYYTPGLHKLVVFYPEKNKDVYRMLTPQGCSAPMLGAIDFMTKLASKKNFATYMFDFSEYLAKPNVTDIGDVGP